LRRFFLIVKLILTKIYAFGLRIGRFQCELGILVNGVEGLFLVAPDDMYVGRHLRKTGCYQRKELSKLGQYITEKSEILVVGAHIGSIGIPLAMKAKSAIFVEPNPSSFRLLQLNVLLNDLKNVRLHNCAVGASEKKIFMLDSKLNSGGSKRLPNTPRYEYTFDNPAVIEVPQVRLDTLVSDRIEFDLAVIDIEGSETSAFRGMSGIFNKIRCLVVEFNPEHIRFVAGESVESSFGQVLEYFDQMEAPLAGEFVVGRVSILTALEKFVARKHCEDGLIFSKSTVIEKS